MRTKKTLRLIPLGVARKLTRRAPIGEVPELDPSNFIKTMD